MTVAVRSAARKKARCPSPADLLAWYDRHARVLPWRWPAAGAARPDPYRVWLSEIMLQQTTVKAVAPYYAKFLARWPTVAALAAAPLRRRAARLGRARLLRARAQPARLREGGGRRGTAARFRTTSTRLRALPGIGDYTAAAIAAIAFDAPAVPVDGNVERVVVAAVRGRGGIAGGKAAIKEFAAIIDAAPPRRRFRAGADGSRRHASARRRSRPARCCPWNGCMRGARARRCRDLSAQGAEARRHSCAAAPLSSRCAPTAACCCAGGPRRACSAA